MNISYFRKSAYPLLETAQRAKEAAAGKGLDIVGEREFPSGHAVFFTNKDWLQNISLENRSMVALLPEIILVTEKDGDVFAGVGNPALIRGAGPANIEEMGAKMAVLLGAIVDEATGAGPQKVKAVKLYSTVACPYCKMEKSWLEEKKIPFELKMVDEDHSAAEEMVRKTGQMGVPVTEIDFEDGDNEIVIGFDRDRLASIFGK